MLTQFPISKFSVVLNIFETGQLQIGHCDKTRQNCLVLSCQFCSHRQHGQDKTVLSCLCQQCEQVYSSSRLDVRLASLVSVGDRSFATAGLRVFNSLPADIASASSLPQHFLITESSLISDIVSGHYFLHFVPPFVA